jgi:hypothetical protein
MMPASWKKPTWSGAWLANSTCGIGAERLLAEAVLAAVRGAAVLPQADVETMVRFVGRGRDDVEDRHRLAGLQLDIRVRARRLACASAS